MIPALLVLITIIVLIIYLIIVNHRKNDQKEFKPTNEEKRLILHDAIFYEIFYAFGVSPHDETNYCSWEHINFSRMGHARALYSFFETSIADRTKRRQKNPDYDDVVSEDFKFGPLKIKRQAEDRKRLNKDLFHLTYARLRHTNKTQPWPDTILSCLHEPCVDFIKHLLVHKNEFGVPDDFKQWEQLLEALTSGRELRISRVFTRVGTIIKAAPNNSFSLGRQLQSSHSELTKPFLNIETTATT